MKTLKSLFHFLGGIHFAIALIAVAALVVIIGTLLESQTGSHLVAARWTYAHPFFQFLLFLFFMNILFSALRRWPFKKKHIPFLITHLGLLMIISGTMIKNRFGLQGQLSAWEGSGSQKVLLPHTFALHIEEKGDSSIKSSLVPLNSFQPEIYHPYHFPHLKCKVIRYAPHVKEHFDTWIKESRAYIAGFPFIPVQTWEASQSFPEGHSHSFSLAEHILHWSILALRSPSVQQALKEAYLQNLTLRLKTPDRDNHLEIPLQQALREPFSFASGQLSATIDIPALALDKQQVPTIHFHWQPMKNQEESWTVALQGQDALLMKPRSAQWSGAPFTIDLIRQKPSICLVDDEEGNTFLFAFDTYGRLHGEKFSSTHLQTLISYDRGFSGYGVQAIVPIPSFPTSREDKEHAQAYALELQLQQALSQAATLTPPLLFFKEACDQAQVDCAKVFLEFLTEWQASPNFLFHPVQPLSSTLNLILAHLNWEQVSRQDQQSAQWTSQILDQLESALNQGESPLDVLEKLHWPLIAELQQAIQQPENASPLNVLAQQIASLTAYLPSLEPLGSLSIPQQAHLLSAYFRNYGIDYRSLSPYRGNEKEQFDELGAYWQVHDPEKEHRQVIVLETPLTHRLVPESPPLKLEECCPGLILEVQQEQQKQLMVLAYDASGSGLKWPMINGHYLIRFQPQVEELPYRLRLRQARQITYPQSAQVYSYEGDFLIAENGKEPVPQTLSMNHVYETWDGYRFYLAGVGASGESGLKRIQLAVNHDPAKYVLTYPGAILIFVGTVLLFWIYPYRKE